MSKAGHNSIIPTRRATLFGAAALASVAVSGSVKASPISPAVQKAFDAWQTAVSNFWTIDRDLTQPALDRFYTILPERRPNGKPTGIPTAKERVAIDAAHEMSGLNAAEHAADAAHEAKETAFERFIGTQPQTMSDVRLQAKHLAQWLEDCDVENPMSVWFETLAKGEVA